MRPKIVNSVFSCMLGASILASLTLLAAKANAGPGYNCGKGLDGCHSGGWAGWDPAPVPPLPGICEFWNEGFKSIISKQWTCGGPGGGTLLTSPPVVCHEYNWDRNECCNLGATWPSCSSITPVCPCPPQKSPYGDSRHLPPLPIRNGGTGTMKYKHGSYKARLPLLWVLCGRPSDWHSADCDLRLLG